MMLLEEKFETPKQLDGEIADLTPDAKLTEEIEADAFKHDIYRAMVNINKKTKALPMAAHATEGGDPPPTLAATATAGSRTPTAASHCVKLPKLTIRPFNRDLTKWTTFWDSYKWAIYKSDEHSGVDKFTII